MTENDHSRAEVVDNPRSSTQEVQQSRILNFLRHCPKAQDIVERGHTLPLHVELIGYHTISLLQDGGDGFFDGQRVELIDGEVILMSPREAGHATAVELTARELERAFGEGYYVRDQKPLDLGEHYEPEPDVVAVIGSPRDYAQAHPKTAVLIVEVALSSVNYDRNVKTSLYAKVGIPEFWLLNLKDRHLEVFREPVSMSNQPFGFGYRSVRIYLPDETVSPLTKPDAMIRVANLLP